MANIKSAFYRIIEHLKEIDGHTSRVLIGPACENWLRSEASVAMNFCDGAFYPLKENEFCYEEDKKRDITIYGDLEEPIVTHAIEIKAIYPAGDESINGKWLDKLHQQLNREPLPDENDATSHIGLIFAIWTSSYNESSREYFSRLSKLIETRFPFNHYTTQQQYRLESIIKEIHVEWRREEFRVALSATYIKKR